MTRRSLRSSCAFAVISLACLSVAHAASEVGPYGSNSVEYKQLSKVGVWKPLTGSTPGGTGVIFQQSGATDVNPKVSDLRIAQSGKGVNVSGKVDVPIGATGKTVPVLAKAAVTGAMYARGVGAILGGPLGLTLLAFPLLSDLINSTPKFRTTPEGGIEKLVDSTDFDKRCLLTPSQQSGWASCVASKNVTSPSFTATSTADSFLQANGTCYYGAKVRTVMNYGAVFNDNHACIIVPQQTIPIDSSKWLPASMDDIAPYMDTPEAPMLPPAVVGEGAKNGVNPFSPTGPEVTVSGPSSVPGSTSSTTSQTRVNDGTTTEAAPGSTTGTQPATKTTTTSTTNNVTYNNNKVTTNTTTTTTTNITNNVTNQTETKTDQETVKEEPVEEPKDESATDTPLGDIPKLYQRKYPDGMVGIWDAKKQSLKDSSVGQLVDQIVPKSMGDSGCPQWQIPLDVGFVSYGIFDASIPCAYWAYLRIIMIVGSLFLARALIFGG